VKKYAKSAVTRQDNSPPVEPIGKAKTDDRMDVSRSSSTEAGESNTGVVNISINPNILTVFF